VRDDDCPDGRVCALEVAPDDPGGVRQLCTRPAGEGLGGEPCEEDADCRSGRCLETGCFAACLDAEDCGPVQECEEVSVLVDDRGTPEPGDDLTTTVRTCVTDPGSGTPCRRDAECPEEDEVCVPRFEPGDQEAELLCTRTPGGAGPGGACRDPVDCASRICLGSGTCLGPCVEDADCPPESPDCTPTRLLVDGEPGPVLTICQPEPVPCVRDADCEEDEACFWTEDRDRPGELVLVCSGAFDGAGAGAPCRSDDDCRTRVCIEEAGRCWGACAGDDDCQGGTRCYDPLLFVSLSGPDEPPLWDGVPACVEDIGSWRECRHNADCPFGEVCHPFADRWRRSWLLRCVHPNGNPLGVPGLLCDAHEDCASGVCLGNWPASACFGVCTGDGDCALGRVCREGRFVVDDRNTPDDPADDAEAPLHVCFL